MIFKRVHTHTYNIINLVIPAETFNEKPFSYGIATTKIQVYESGPHNRNSLQAFSIS